jgi:hypothetical protein
LAGLDVNRGAKRAREARVALRLGTGPLGCVLEAVEERYPVIVAAMPEGIAGASWSGLLLWVNGNQMMRRQRFTLAHELGHAWCGHDGALEPDTFATLGGKTTNPYEVQANAFAAEFLVPAAGLRERVRPQPTLEDVVALASEYGVSAPVIVYRLKVLKLASAERIARLEGEVESGEHAALFGSLGLEPLEDGLARIEQLPYLSPALAGSLLEAALRGDAAVDRKLAGAIGRLLA